MQQQRNAQQDRAMNVQMQQAKMKDEAAQADLAKANAVGQQETNASAFYQQIGQLGKNNPTIYSDPTKVAGILSRAKAMGIDTSAITTQDAQGRTIINPSALNPSKTLADMTDDERMKYMAMDPQTRQAAMKSQFSDFAQQAGSDQWKDFVNAPPYSPVTATEKAQLEKAPIQLAADVGSGKMSPQDYKGAVTALYPRMKAADLNPDYLLSDENLRAQASALTKAQIQKDVAMGIHWKNEDKVNEARQARAAYEFGVKEADKKYQFTVSDMRYQTRAANAANNLSFRAQELKMSKQRFLQAQQDASVRMTATQQAVLNRAYTTLNGQYTSIQKELDKLKDMGITLAAQTSGRWDYDQQTKDRMTGLEKQLKDLQPQLEAARAKVVNAPAEALTSITGKKSEVVGASGLPPGWHQVKDNGDGTFDVSDGKTTRKWRN
jgi:hypothetical protein